MPLKEKYNNIKFYKMNLIIGAGITGLSIGSFLEDQNYLIIEATDSIGGYCKTIKKDGFVWDYSGHFFHFKSSPFIYFYSLKFTVNYRVILLSSTLI